MSDRNRKLVRLALVLPATAGLILAFLGHLELVASFGTPLDRFLVWVNHLRLDVRVGQALLGVSAVALVVVCRRMSGRSSGRYWWTLAGVFGLAFLVRLSGSFRRFVSWLRSFDTSAAWHGWQVSSLILFALEAILAGALVLFFLRWVLGLEPKVRNRVLAGGTLFVAGAVGFEGVTEWLWSVYGSASVQYIAADFVEDVLEAAGLILFVEALMSQLVVANREQELTES